MMHKLYSLHTKQRRETWCVFYRFTTPNYSKNSMYMYAVHGRPQQEVKKQISKTLVRVVEVQVQVHVQV